MDQALVIAAYAVVYGLLGWAAFLYISATHHMFTSATDIAAIDRSVTATCAYVIATLLMAFAAHSVFFR